MSRRESKIFIFIGSILLLVFGFSCQTGSNEEAENSSALFDFSSDTEKAAKLVQQANEDLKKIKILYNQNQNALKELKEASKNRESEKVKTISTALIYAINEGFIFADSAITKIEAAQELNINQDYKDYLSLKELSLKKQLEAFKSLYEATQLLSETAGSQNREQAEQARLSFKEKEENFQSKMEEAKKISVEADELAKESIKKSN